MLYLQCVMMRCPEDSSQFLMHEWGLFFEEVNEISVLQIYPFILISLHAHFISVGLRNMLL